MRYVILPALLLAGCGVDHHSGANSAPTAATISPSIPAGTDLVVTGNNQVVIVPPNSHIANIIVTGNGNSVIVGISSTVGGIVSFHGSYNEVHVSAAYWGSLGTHEDSGDYNHLYGDVTSG